MKKGFMFGLAVLALLLVDCGKSSSGSSGSTSTSGGTTKTEGDPVALSGTIAIGTSLSLADTGEEGLELATSGTIKCTYATETEDKADVGSDGTFKLSCKSGKAMVMSFFDTDGNPTCSILFKVSKKDTATASINQDIAMGKITCTDGSASVDLDTLAPTVAAAQVFKQDTSVTLVNSDTNHWAFTISKQAMIGADGKAASNSSDTGKKSRKKSSSLALEDGEGLEAASGTGGQGQGGGNEVGKTVKMAFMEETCDGAAVAAGIITVQHEEQSEGDTEGGNWECIDGATITWTGKSFSVSLTEEKDVLEDLAEHEIDNQRPPQETVQFAKVGEDGKVAEINRDPTQELTHLTDLDLANEGFAPPDSIVVGMNFPVEAYCGSTKWKLYLDTEAFGTPCTNLSQFKFVDFGKICSLLPATATGANDLAKSSVMQCSVNGAQAPTASSANQHDPQCAADYKDFPDGRSPVDDMSRGVADLRSRLALIVKLNDLAIAGDANVVAHKDILATAVALLKAALTKVTDQMTIMEAAVAQIKANRITRCTATTQTPRDPNAERALYAKMDGSKLQPLFNAFQQLYDRLVNQDPRINQIFRRYVSAPTNGFDGTACVIPAGADTVYNFGFLKPTGTCKFTSNITIAGVFKDASTIKPMDVTFMDKPNGECSLSVQHIAFDSTTGCWKWDGLKPLLESESVDKTGMFKGGLIQRMKLTGSAVIEED